MEACTELWELGPPPDYILNIPPPPIPENFQLFAANLTATSPCGFECDIRVAQGAELVETARPGRLNDDIWLFVALSCGLIVLICSSLLAIFLVRVRESRDSKISLHEEQLHSSKTCEVVLYPPGVQSKVLWATLTPKGKTQHYATLKPTLINSPQKISFENSAFESPDDYLARRPKVSLPTKIENPNIPPLNLYPSLRKSHLNQSLLL